MSHIPVLCIDGPSGSGKGTIAAQVREALGWHYLDSGAVYRLVALSALRADVAFDDEAALVELVQKMDAGFDNGVSLNGEDVSTELRTETTGNAASKVAAVPAVREALLQWQRDFRQAPGIVADGRDMGTVVFPEADVKIFLTASAEERAERRYKQLKDKGLDVNLADLSREIRERDERDANRAVAPLKPADDAQVLDSTGVSINKVVQSVLDAVKAAGL